LNGFIEMVYIKYAVLRLSLYAYFTDVTTRWLLC